MTLATTRLRLVAATISLLQLELRDMVGFARELGAEVPAEWPPGEYDADAIRFFIDKLQEDEVGGTGWFGWYAIRTADRDAPATLAGCGGYMGPPDANGTVEIGFSICERFRGQGLATELAAALVERAFAIGASKVIARTSDDNGASIAVLVKCGFLQAESTERGTILFERC